MSKILETPRVFEPRSLECGPATVELLLFNRRLHSTNECGVGDFKVQHKTLGGMLPGDMVRELNSRGLRAKLKNAPEGHSEALTVLKRSISGGYPVPLFVDRGIGHWVVAWGYSENCVYTYDVSKGVPRDEKGLTSYTNDELLGMWENNIFWRMLYGKNLYIDIRPDPD